MHEPHVTAGAGAWPEGGGGLRGAVLDEIRCKMRAMFYFTAFLSLFSLSPACGFLPRAYLVCFLVLQLSGSPTPSLGPVGEGYENST